MTPSFGLMMFWLPEMRMRPLWMSAMRRPRMPQTMLAVSVRVTVTLTTLNSVMINLNSVMINVILNFLMGWGLKQWRFLSMYPPPPIIRVRKDGDALAAVDFDPAIILKCHTQKVIANPHQLLVVSNATGVINSVFMRDKFIPYLVAQLQKVPGEA